SRPASQLLQVDKKRFEFGRSRVRAADEWRERVGEPVPAFARVAVRREPHVAPMNRDADLIHLLPGHCHRSETFGYEREHFDLAPLGRNPDMVAALDALLPAQ